MSHDFFLLASAIPPARICRTAAQASPSQHMALLARIRERAIISTQTPKVPVALPRPDSPRRPGRSPQSEFCAGRAKAAVRPVFTIRIFCLCAADERVTTEASQRRNVLRKARGERIRIHLADAASERQRSGFPQGGETQTLGELAFMRAFLLIGLGFLSAAACTNETGNAAVVQAPAAAAQAPAADCGKPAAPASRRR